MSEGVNKTFVVRGSNIMDSHNYNCKVIAQVDLVWLEKMSTNITLNYTGKLVPDTGMNPRDGLFRVFNLFRYIEPVCFKREKNANEHKIFEILNVEIRELSALFLSYYLERKFQRITLYAVEKCPEQDIAYGSTTLSSSKTKTWQQCGEKCRISSQCVAFSFTTANHSDTEKRRNCDLKSGIETRTVEVGVVSGTKACGGSGVSLFVIFYKYSFSLLNSTNESESTCVRCKPVLRIQKVRYCADHSR